MRGDQIYVMREFLNLTGVYEHHGIDGGDGTVIHYRKPSETIERSSIATFSRGQSIYLKKYRTSFIPDVVMQRAESRLGEQKYNLLFNNCEHFATWCKIGISESQQIKDFIPLISHFSPEQLEQPLQEALGATDMNNAQKIVEGALGDLKVVWDNLQPQYKQARSEMQTWERVAKEALKRNREDLARKAIQQKLIYQKKAQNLETQLQSLGKMTETLLRNAGLRS